MPTDFKPKRRTDRDTIAYAEFNGLRNDIAPERFDASDLAVATNVTIDKARRIARRDGATRRIALAAHSLWAGNGDSLFVSAGTLYRFAADLVPHPLRGSMSNATMSYARAGDTTYFSNGTDTGAADPAARTWGLEVPAVLLTPVAGDMPCGVYGVTATYVRSDGQESGADDMTFITVVTGQGVTVTVPNSADPDVVGKRVYITTPNGEVPMHVKTLLAAGAGYTVTAADIDAMNEELKTQFMGPPPAGQLVAYYKGCMFVACDDVIYPSEPFAYELFDLRKFIPMDGTVTMLAPMEDRSGDSSGFFVGTTKTCGVLTGGGPEDFKYTPKTEYGAIPGAVASIDGALYLDGSVGARELPMWLTTQGLCVGLPNLDINNLTRSRYTFTADGAGAAMFDPTINMFVARSGSNPAIAFQTENQTLTAFSNFAYNSFARAYGKNLAADATGVHELVGDTDNGAAIDAVISTGVTDFGSTFVKALDRLYVGYRSAADMSVVVRTDDALDTPYIAPVSDQTGLATQRVKVGKGLAARYWQFTVKNIGGADFLFDTIDVKSAQLARRINGRA